MKITWANRDKNNPGEPSIWSDEVANEVKAVVNSNDDNKQDLLSSGVNIKTINGASILGSGNLVVGGVTSVSAGNLSPIFTTTVNTATSTPAIVFALTNAAQNTILAGPSTGGAGSPSYRALVAADIPGLNYWSLNGGSTLLGVATITSNVANQHVFTGTWTATANSQNHISITPTITARNTGADEVKGVVIAPTLNAAANNQVLTTLDLTTLYDAKSFSGITNFAIKANGIIASTIPAGGDAVQLTNSSTSSGISIGFFRSTVRIGTIAGTGSTATNPNAIYIRTDLAAGNFLLATGNNVVGMTMDNSQRVGIGTASLTPTAWLHIQAGTTTTPAQRYDAGTLNTTALTGSKEYDGTHFETPSSGLRYSKGGIVANFFADANNAGTGETDLYSYTTPANTLNAIGEKIQAVYSGMFNDNTSTANLRVYFAGTVVGATGAVSVTAVSAWTIRVMIIRTGASTARASVSVSSMGGTADFETDLSGLTFSGTNVIKITGQAGGGGGGSNDITAKLGTVMWWGRAQN